MSDIAKALTAAGVPLPGSAMTDRVAASLATLGASTLVTTVAPAVRARGGATKARRGPPRRPPILRFASTERGRATLCQALGVGTTPSWAETCGFVVPALALGHAPATAAARAALTGVSSMRVALLRRDRMLGEPVTISDLCDQIIARALGMPPGVATANHVRAYALAMHCGVDRRDELEQIAAQFVPPAGNKRKKADPELNKLAARLVSMQLGRELTTKKQMVSVLVRRWVGEQGAAETPAMAAPAWATPLRPAPPQVPAAVVPPAMPALPIGATSDALLDAVREAITRVGAAGRYGKENVFVSALWRQLAHDRRAATLSLEHFKRWLVAANREQLLALARADLVDEMEPRLVEDSEIEDLGTTFHFVLDHREPSSGAGVYRDVR